MVALTPTVTEVLMGTDAPILRKLAGETITQGMPVYVKAADNRFWKANAVAAAAAASVVGIALNSAAAGQPMEAQTDGLVTIGTTAAMTVGKTYCVGAVAGTIVPQADLVNANVVSIIGVATTAGVLKIEINVTGAVVP